MEPTPRAAAATTIATAVEQPPTGRRILAIYVLSECLGCAEARRLASDLGASGDCARLGIEVRLVDLAAPGAVRPPAVFAVPTYLLDGRVLSLGTPDPAWLRAQLAASSSGGEAILVSPTLSTGRP